MPLRYALALSALTLGTLLTPAAAQQLSIPDAAVSVPDDTEFTLANETSEPVVLDSLAMRFNGVVGELSHIWYIDTRDGGSASFSCWFSGIFESDDPACSALPVEFPAGAVVRLGTGYDPCGICRQNGAPRRARKGGAPDTLLVYSGGSVVPGRVLFDDAGFVALDDEPASAEVTLGVGPNPSAGEARVSLTLGKASTSVEASVHDALGRRVALLHDGPLAPGTSWFGLDTSGWAAGVYVVRASAGGHAMTARLTVAR